MLLALSLVAAVATAPAVERTRLFCRATGVEILPNACPDEANAPAGLAQERCCESRVQGSLAEAKLESAAQADLSLAIITVELQWDGAPRPRPAPVPQHPYPSRPPLSATRILLI